MRKLLVFVLLLIGCRSYSQEDVSSFKFTSMVDVTSFENSNYYGRLNVDLPLYDIKMPHFRFPLKLSYNQTGNVNTLTKGGQFGDAWNINIEGAVTRTIRKREVIPGGAVTLYATIPATLFRKEIIGEYKDFPTRIVDEFYYRDFPNATERPDDERDVFRFNVLGLSGTFFISKDLTNGRLKVKLLEASDFCEITIIPDDMHAYAIKGFEIKDKNGFRYVLNQSSSIGQNIAYRLEYGPGVSTFLQDPNNFRYSFKPGADINPDANVPLNSKDPNKSYDNVVVYAFLKVGERFWESMLLTSILDKEGREILNITYEDRGVSWNDPEYYYTYNEGGRHTETSQIKEIGLAGIGKIIFNNVRTLNYQTTTNITVKDLKENIIKEISFDYVLKGTSPNGRGYSKVLLTKIKDFSNLTQPQFTELFYNTTLPAPMDELDIDHGIGYVTKGFYQFGFFGSKNFAANLYALQKIKYPTGGTVLYKFGPNTVLNHNSHFGRDPEYKKNNLDNQIFVNIFTNYSSNPGEYGHRFNVTENDLVFILPNNGNAKLYHVAANGTKTLIANITTGLFMDYTTKKMRRPSYNDNPYRWWFKQLDPGTYFLEDSQNYGGGAQNRNHIRRMNYVPSTQMKSFYYTDGMRIDEIAYFTENVNQNLLEQGQSADAEKYTVFNYTSMVDQVNSGRIAMEYKPYQETFPENPVFYKEVGVSNRGVGTEVTYFNELKHVEGAKKINKKQVYDNAGGLISETDYSRMTQSYTSITYLEDLYLPVVPFDTQVNTMQKVYEESAFLELNNVVDYSPVHRQQLYASQTDALGKTAKSEFDYDIKGNVIVNTQSRNYINNTLINQVVNTYDATGNILKTEFKTPDMSAYEKVGNENTRYNNGLLTGYYQADGTPVTLVYGYNNTQIVAKMINVEASAFYALYFQYQQIRTNITNYSNQNGTSYNETNLKNALNSLRATFSDAMVTTYIYKPMVGISSITDENGKETTYEYDVFNRLKTVKDYAGNILKEYQYNFTN